MDHLQSILQYMIANGCVESQNFKDLIVQIGLIPSLDQLSDENVSQVVAKCNRKITKYNMMIRSTMDEVFAKRYYVLISTVDNEVTQAAHYHTPKQFEFFKLLLTNIVGNPRGIICFEELDNLANIAGVQTKGKSRKSIPEHRAIYNEWCTKNWLLTISENNAQYITLGVRSMAELDVFIKQKLVENPEDLNCKNCDHISIYSVICSRCDARYHKRCAKMSIDPDTSLCKECK